MSADPDARNSDNARMRMPTPGTPGYARWLTAQAKALTEAKALAGAPVPATLDRAAERRARALAMAGPRGLDWARRWSAAMDAGDTTLARALCLELEEGAP